MRAARRQGRRRPITANSAAPRSRSSEAVAAVRWRLAEGRKRAGLDEPWRPGDRDCRRASALSAHRTARPSPPSPTRSASSTACSSIPKWCTRRAAPSCSQFRAHDRRHAPRLEHARLPRHEVATHPRAGRQGARDLRPVGRRRFSASPRVLIHEAIGEQLTCIFVDHGLMRAGRGGRSRLAVPRPLQHPADPCRCERDVSSPA